MKIKYQIVESDYNGLYSYVRVNSKWGGAEHTVYLQPEDEDIANSHDGCRFAECLCVADLFEKKGRALHQRALGIEHAADVVNDAMWKSGGGSISLGGKYSASDAVLQMRCTAETIEKQSKENLDAARNIRDNYENFCRTVLDERRNIRKKISK